MSFDFRNFGLIFDQRAKVLKSNGTDSQLIKSLLSDARLWGVLNKLLEDQVSALKSLQGSYENENLTVLHEEDSKERKRKIKDFSNITDSRSPHSLSQKSKLLEKLTKTSETLIQMVKQPIFSLKILANMATGVQSDIDCGSSEVNVYE